MLADYIIAHGGAATVPEMMVDSELALYLQGVFLKDISLTGGEPAFLRALAKADYFFGQRGEQYFLRADLGPPPPELIELVKRIALGRIETGSLEPYSELTVLAMASVVQRGGTATLKELAADLEPYISGAFLAHGRIFFSGPLHSYHLDHCKHLQRKDGAFCLADAAVTPSASELEATRALCKLRRSYRERLTSPSALYSLLIESCRLRNGDVERDVAPLMPGLCTATGKRFTLTVKQLMEAAPFYFQRLKKGPSADESVSTKLTLDYLFCADAPLDLT